MKVQLEHFRVNIIIIIQWINELNTLINYDWKAIIVRYQWLQYISISFDKIFTIKINPHDIYTLIGSFCNSFIHIYRILHILKFKTWNPIYIHLYVAVLLISFHFQFTVHFRVFLVFILILIHSLEIITSSS